MLRETLNVSMSNERDTAKTTKALQLPLPLSEVSEYQNCMPGQQSQTSERCGNYGTRKEHAKTLWILVFMRPKSIVPDCCVDWLVASQCANVKARVHYFDSTFKEKLIYKKPGLQAKLCLQENQT